MSFTNLFAAVYTVVLSASMSGLFALGRMCKSSSECIKSADSVYCGSYDVEDLAEPPTYSVEETFCMDHFLEQEYLSNDKVLFPLNEKVRK